MAEPFVGQIEMFAFGFAPRPWATCAGQLLPIAQNSALFSLLGTYYGGDGRTTFALPDLRGRVPLGMGASWPIGTAAGNEAVALDHNSVPVHIHTLNAADADAGTTDPGATVALGRTTGAHGVNQMQIYVNAGGRPEDLNSATIAPAGGAPHENRMPSLAVNFCIALSGIFPSRG